MDNPYKCIFPRLIISGKICSYQYEYPRDLVCVYKFGLNGIIHLGVFAGGSFKISRFVSHDILLGQPSSAAPIPTDLGAIFDAQK